MKEKVFNEIVDKILVPVIDDAVKRTKSHKIGNELKEIISQKHKFIYKKYETSRKIFKRDNFIIKEPRHKWIDKSKIAALFYISFIEIIKTNHFFSDKSRCFFAHNVATNAAIAIMESFILAKRNEKDEKYRIYVREHGIVKPIKEYANKMVETLVLMDKKTGLSFFLIANIFCSIEDKSREKFEESIKKGIYV
jgi:phenylpropionate dioxygenase-like ring-hydroxylating dioxygenase large terminal subunit